MKLLPAQRLRPHYYGGVEEALREHFRVVLFDPLLAILAEAGAAGTEYANAPAPEDVLVRALTLGRVQYVGGRFTGDFDAAMIRALVRLGAERDNRNGTYPLPEWLAPAQVRAAAAVASRRGIAVAQKLERELARIQERLEAGFLGFTVDPTNALAAVEDGFGSAASALGIRKDIPPRQREAIERTYQENVRPRVTEDTAVFIDRIHAEVTASALQGYRFERMVRAVKDTAAISENRARFIARQETSLFMASYRATRFEAAGVTRYVWSTSHDIRVRPYADLRKLVKYGDHRVLDEQIFFYATKAPARFMSNRRPCNPGEDYGCRCNDRGIIE